MTDLQKMDCMTKEDKLECAKSNRNISLSYQQAAERRGAELADEFSRLEVQIATILFAFSGFFFDFFNKNIGHFQTTILFLLKFIFASTLFFLITSLSIGLLHIKRKEKFWDEISKQRLIRLLKWSEVEKGKTSYEEAQAFHDGTGLQKGYSVSSPAWSWMLQTISLGIAVVLLFTLFLVFLFN